jgi:hypothetical protein
VDPEVAGSKPVTHPIQTLNAVIQIRETFNSARKSWLKWAHEHIEGVKALRFPLNDAGLARITHDASTASAETQL